MLNNIKTVLFDLDGTLLDTAPDMAFALNQLRQNYDLPPLPYERIKPRVSHGASAMLKLGFNIDKNAVGYAELCQQFLQIYSENLTQNTQIYPGILQVLNYLQEQEVTWGVVTNKPAWLTDPLVAHFAFSYPPVCVISGDTVKNPKPHPEPLFHACKLICRQCGDCVYVGDAERDIQAAQQACMRSLVAAYGYIGEDETPSLWKADGILNTPMELITWLEQQM